MVRRLLPGVEPVAHGAGSETRGRPGRRSLLRRWARAPRRTGARSRAQLLKRYVRVPGRRRGPTAGVPGGDHDHDGAMERRYLVVPGIRSSGICVLDTGPDPRQPSLVRTIEPEEVMGEGHYSRPIDDVEESARPTTVPASSAKRNRRPLRVGCGAEPPWRRPRQPPTPQAACDGRFGSRRADRCTDCQPRRSSRSRDLPGAGSEATEANPHGR